jgi:hypothetical protein
MEKLADHFKELLEANAEGFLSGRHCDSTMIQSFGYGSIPINTIFSGMNIHLPAILMFTRGTRF